jgi:hypothetical protein
MQKRAEYVGEGSKRILIIMVEFIQLLLKVRFTAVS